MMDTGFLPSPGPQESGWRTDEERTRQRAQETRRPSVSGPKRRQLVTVFAKSALAGLGVERDFDLGVPVLGDGSGRHPRLDLRNEPALALREISLRDVRGQ